MIHTDANFSTALLAQQIKSFTKYLLNISAFNKHET